MVVFLFRVPWDVDARVELLRLLQGRVDAWSDVWVHMSCEKKGANMSHGQLRNGPRLELIRCIYVVSALHCR